MRPTGRLHLGHYIGVLQNWVSLQAQMPCYFMIADYHALTTQYDRTANLSQNVTEMVLDWLAAGIDPDRAVLYAQSWVPEIAQLHLLLGMLTPTKWVETDPTLKDMVAMLDNSDLTYGLLGYPILQTADILAMRANRVPVGKDQLAHLEISRDLARRFNHQYQTKLFEEPRPLLAEVPLLQGLDGRKMGKSYGNAIFLADTAEETTKKIKTAITDPQRVKRQDPGNPTQCAVVFNYYTVFAEPETIASVDAECRSAARGCVDCKMQLADLINAQLAPMRERRQELAQDPARLGRILRDGTEKARQRASDTLAQVKRAMSMDYVGLL